MAMLWSRPGCQSTDERIKWFTDSILKTKMMSSSEKRTQKKYFVFPLIYTHSVLHRSQIHHTHICIYTHIQIYPYT